MLFGRLPNLLLLLLLFSCPVMFDSLWPHGLQHARLPCPSLSPRVCSNLCPLSRWCHATISSSVTPFSSCPQFFPATMKTTLLVKAGEMWLHMVSHSDVGIILGKILGSYNDRDWRGLYPEFEGQQCEGMIAWWSEKLVSHQFSICEIPNLSWCSFMFCEMWILDHFVSNTL